MTNSKQGLSRIVLVIQLICSESLIVAIKILFLISLMLTNSDLSVLKFGYVLN